MFTLGFQKPGPAVQAPSETKAGEKGAEGVEKGKPAEEGAKGEVLPPSAEAPAAQPMEGPTKMGRADYKPPERVGPASSPFVSFLGRPGAQAAVQAAGPPTPGPGQYAPFAPPEVPPPIAYQPPGLVGPPMAPATVVVTRPKPPSFFEEHANWPGGVPGRPATPRVYLPLTLRGTVLGDKPCAIVWDGSRNRIVGEGDSLTIEGHKVVFREIGKGYAQVVFNQRVRTLRLMEGT